MNENLEKNEIIDLNNSLDMNDNLEKNIDLSKDKMKYDILKELFNISVGKAADILSEIVSKKNHIRCP